MFSWGTQKKKRMGKTFVFLLVAGWSLAFAPPRVYAQSGLRVKVKVETANIRSEAALTARVVASVNLGTLLDVVRKTGDWYEVGIPGRTTRGFISALVVDELPTAGAREAPPAARPSAGVPAGAAVAPPAGEEDRDTALLSRIEDLTRKDSVALLSLIKTMAPKVTESKGIRSIRRAKVITARCGVLESNVKESRSIYSPLLGEEFAVLSQVDDMVEVRLRDGREGWIEESCVQITSQAETVRKVVYTGISASKRNAFLKTAGDLFARIAQNKNVADEVLAGASRTGGASPRLATLHGLIVKYHGYASRFFNEYLAGQEPKSGEGRPLAEALSAWADVLAGTADYGVESLLGGPRKENGLILDAAAAGTLTLSDTAAVDVNLAHLSDVIRAPYSTTTVGAGYAYDDRRRTSYRAGVSYNAFSEADSPESAYGRFSLRGNGRFALSDRADIDVDYTFLSHAYSDPALEGADYTGHLIRLGGRFLQGPSSRFLFQVRSNIQASDSAIRSFLNLDPSVTYEKTGPDSLLRLTGDYEMFSFGDLPALSSNRISALLQTEKTRDDRLRAFDAGVASKSFPERIAGNYVQVRLRYASSRSAPATKLFSATALTYLFPNAEASGFTDIRLDRSTESAFVFADMSLFSRVWHSPGWGTFSSKPFVLDLTGRLGFNLKYLRIGPTVGLHALVSTDTGVQLIKRDGNVFRFGAMAEGTIPLPSRGRLALSAQYEYGFVYDTRLAFYGGDVAARHPTSLLVSGDLTLPVSSSLDLVGRLDLYRIATGMGETFAYNPRTADTKFKLLAGVRYRYN